MSAPPPSTVQIRVLSGGPAGSTFTFGPAPVAIGRGPEAGLRFDAEKDLTVSSRHAVLYADEGRWWVRDLDSRNGTYLNGRRITATMALSDGDRLAFGSGGPEIQVQLAAARDTADPARALWIAAALVTLLLGVIGVLLVANQRQRSAWANERAALVASIDSLLAIGDQRVIALQGDRQVVADALQSAQQDLRSARAGLDRAVATGDDSLADAMRREIQARAVAVQRQHLAASLDFDAIEDANRSAVALVYVQDESGQVNTGTAFAVRPDATLVTARHVIFGSDGDRQPARIGIQFSDSDQVFPARVVRISEEADVAVLRADNILGRVPTIQEFNLRTDTLGLGVPVAVIGFPLGGSPESMSGDRPVARPLVSAGIVTRWAADRIEIQGHGAAGASGSPIFDAAGRTIGLLFGGIRTDNDQTVYGVPSPRIVATLQQVR